MALFMFVIGFVLTLIFAKAGRGYKERTVALLSIVVHLMTIAEGFIIKMNKESGGQFSRALYD